MKKIFSIFQIKDEERWLSAGILAVLVYLNTLLITKYYDIFTPLSNRYWHLFIHNFHVSGFDPITYYVVSDWNSGYNIYRHPLLAIFMYIPYLINMGLMKVTGINCAIFIVAIIQTFFALYSQIFLFRIFREVIGIAHKDAILLTMLFSSFAFIMLSNFMPDHFVMSMMLLILALYISGKKIKSQHKINIWQGILYFILTAGTSLNNGLKIFISGLFVNEKKFFRPKYFLLAVFLPAIAIWSFSKWEYKTFVWPQENARHIAKMKAQEKCVPRNSTKTIVPPVQKYKSERNITPHKDGTKTHKESRNHQWTGKPISNGEFMRWTDVSTSRSQSIVENLFGESIQLHKDHLLEDVMHSRPIIVKYNCTGSYIIECIIVLLFLVGIWYGRHSRFLWLAMSYFGLDLALHIGLGFGINEVYIMSAHWIYVIPIAMAYLFASLSKRNKYKSISTLRIVTIVTTSYLFVYNATMITLYLAGA